MLNQIKTGLKSLTNKIRPLKAKKAGQKRPTSRAKSPTTKSTKPTKNENLASDFRPHVDPAHEPGHKKLNLNAELNKNKSGKNKPMDASAQNRMSPSNEIRRKEIDHRRISATARRTKS